MIVLDGCVVCSVLSSTVQRGQDVISTASSPTERGIRNRDHSLKDDEQFNLQEDVEDATTASTVKR
jgi:hypothetical protein